ncbi:TatD family hydrolase [Thiomicrorhabdus cannonii]|uniref:TatD family hydrolase n=1 Tax=Thiomicrorhabdus cannonii TaxID=2748011 RepID=UPI0015BD6682|nr:TatD family hydrolase [Thiomicrorhabdus cannonii]
MIIDTHCHLDLLTADDLYAELMPDRRYLTMSTGMENWQAVSTLARSSANIYAAFGIHPWFVCTQSDNVLSELSALIESDKPTAIGEIGLDFSASHSHSRHLQVQVFEQQLTLAADFKLPVSLHVVKAHEVMLALLKRYRPQGVVHSLGASIELARRYVDLGFKIGVNGIVLRDNARRYHQLVSYFGLDHIVLESDAPNIALPGAKTGHLHDIDRTIARIAELSGLQIDDVIAVSGHNAQQIFQFR